jgi:hypothetical protein
MKEMTHDRCSELLGAFASGKLDENERAAVAGHLSSCPDCSLELAAIEALAGPDLVAMTGPERDQLDRAVRDAVITPARPGWSERWGRRAAPALGAMALLAIVAMAIVSLPGDDAADTPATTGVEDTAGIDRGTEAETKAEPLPASEGGDQEAATLESSDAVGGGAATGAGGDAGFEGQGAPGATSLRAIAGTTVSDQSFAVAGLDLGTLVPPRSPKQVNNLNYSVEPLADSAPNERVADLIRTCSERAISNSLVGLVATSATYFPSDDLLVVGFVWVDASTNDLYFEIRGWRDGRCDRVTPIFRRGLVE